MSEELPPQGLVTDYNDMSPIPVIKYDSINNALIFDNPVQTSSGIASSELAPLSFNSPAVLIMVFRRGSMLIFPSLSRCLYHLIP